jgi:hypothetical protein
MTRTRFAFLTPAFFVCLGCTSKGSEQVRVTENDLSATGPTVCDGNRLLQGVSASVTQCCQLGNDNWFVSPRTGGIAHLNYGPTCSTLDGGTDCVGFECDFGPCMGARIVSVVGGPPSHVFKPLTNPAVCGWAAGGDGFFPEPYSTQELWAGVDTLCPWTFCAGDGLPGVVLTVTAIGNGATGIISSKPAGIDLVGPGGPVSAIFTQLDIKLTAKALGPHARVQFSGDCSDSGRVGQTVQCKLTLGPNKAVTVTYLCEPGWTCQL